MSIEIFSDAKFKKLKNSYYHPILYKDKKWNTTNNYIYSQLLCYPTYQTIVRNTRDPITQYKHFCSKNIYETYISIHKCYYISFCLY